MSRCVCPGSFDPVTWGHLDVVRRATGLFDEVVVAVVHNPAKTGRLPVETRTTLLREALADENLAVRVEVIGEGLLAEHCRRWGAAAIVKGLRGERDYGYELPMALMNRQLTGVETVFVAGDPRWAHVSSSLVAEVAALGGDVSGLVPPGVVQALGHRT